MTTAVAAASGPLAASVYALQYVPGSEQTRTLQYLTSPFSEDAAES